MNKKLDDNIIALIAQLGARCDRVESLEHDVELWRKWHDQEADKVRKLRKQLEDNNLHPEI
jgi:hypothetical protein